MDTSAVLVIHLGEEEEEEEEEEKEKEGRAHFVMALIKSIQTQYMTNSQCTIYMYM